MTTAILNYSRIQKEIKEKVDLIDFPTVNWKLVCCLGFLVCISLLIFYVWQINSLTHGYYLINTYENQLNSIIEENKKLEVAFAEASFWGQALEKMQELNFQKATSIKYIQIPSSYLAKAN